MRKGLLLMGISWSLAASELAPVASADDWVGYYESPSCTRLDEGTGSFHDGSNWYDLTPPVPGETAIFNADFDPEQNGIPTRVVLGDFTVRQIGSLCGNYFVPGSDATVAYLEVVSGDFILDLGGRTLDVSPNENFSALIVGLDGRTASLAVEGNGTLRTLGVRLGDSSRPSGISSTGSLTIREGSLLDVEGFLLVGSGSTGGHLVVDPGARVSVRTAGIGAAGFTVGGPRSSLGASVSINGSVDARSTRFVLNGDGSISGAGVLHSGQLEIGTAAPASLLISEGGTLVSGEDAFFRGAYIGAGSSGGIRVRDDASSWTNDGPIVVGLESSGSLQIENGGFVHSVDGRVAQLAGSDGTVFVDNDLPGGGRSIWQIDDSFYVGGNQTTQGGEAFVEVDRGGLITVGNHMTIWDDAAVDLREGGSILIGAGDAEPVEDTVVLQGGGSLSGAGTLRGNVLVADGTIAPGSSPGTLVIDGDATFGANASMEIELAGVEPGVDHDRIEINGSATLGGILAVSFLDDFESAITVEDTFALLDVTGVLTGEFSNASSGARLLTADGLGSFEIWYGAGSPFDPTIVMLSAFQPIPEPGTGALVVLALAGLSGKRKTQGRTSR